MSYYYNAYYYSYTHMSQLGIRKFALSDTLKHELFIDYDKSNTIDKCDHKQCVLSMGNTLTKLGEMSLLCMM